MGVEDLSALKFIYMVAAALLAGAVAACDMMPGTGAYRVERGKRTIARKLIDPSSAQFRNVHLKNGWVCGELNGKNKMGAFVGFTRFVVQADGNEAQLDPGFDPSELMQANDLCQSMRGNEYSSASTTASVCGRAVEQRLNQLLQSKFDRDWRAKCGGPRARSTFQPPLITVT